MPIMRPVKLFVPALIVLSALPAFGIQEGLASWYGGKFNGRLTSSGEVFDANEKTAAHRTLPFGAIVQVVNLENGRSTVVKINDRGPFVEGRIIDLSRAAAEDIGMVAQGVARVSIEVLDFAVDKRLYSIQVGAYDLAQNAEKVRASLESSGFIVFLEKNPLGITRVVIGGLDEKSVPQARERLQALGFKKLLVRAEARGSIAEARGAAVEAPAVKEASAR